MNQAWFFSLATIVTFLHLISAARPFDGYPSANINTTWINNDPGLSQDRHSDGSMMRYIFLNQHVPPTYACGFYCNGTCEDYLFAVMVAVTGIPQVVWTANRNNPVKLKASLQLTLEGDLILKDADGTLVWSTRTSNKSVAGLHLTEVGNLVLSDKHNSTVWESFDHPTDALVPGQRILPGQKLVSSVSDSNWTEGLYSLLFTKNGFTAFRESNPPIAYYQSLGGYTDFSYAEFQNGSFNVFRNTSGLSDQNERIPILQATGRQIMKLRPDGHLKVYEYSVTKIEWKEVADVFKDDIDECRYPEVCGKYGICLKGQCSCPKSSTDSTEYFKPVSIWQPDLGCSAVTPLISDAYQHHSFIELKAVTYFPFRSDINNTSINNCKEACLRNFSCKAAIFRTSKADCYLPSEIFSMTNVELDKPEIVVFLKVQIGPTKRSHRPAILGFATGGSLLLIIISGLVVFIIRKKENVDKDEEEYLDHVPGMPTRFSYEEMKIATENFSTKLGEGGFGTVFEGVLRDGTKIAVKCLSGVRQVKESFLAEVETIGRIHHVNLVRLVGFCVEKSHRLLVYEYMTNGSLDGWIYNGSQCFTLSWKCRKNIIRNVAKGLAYLHEECREKIVHLDVKPQNILLDENCNAKLSDFGLSKLIDRDQSKVVTNMRGTPGYLAPEWLGAVITEKVDVYSFGIVVLEILCGRKNFELSEPEECRHLLSLFKMKVEERQLFDLIDKRNENMQSHGTEVVEIMQVAALCLQSDHSKRPSMSMVVKFLEGDMDVEKRIDYNSLNSQISARETFGNLYADSTPLPPLVLSGPR